MQLDNFLHPLSADDLFSHLSLLMQPYFVIYYYRFILYVCRKNSSFYYKHSMNAEYLLDIEIWFMPGQLGQLPTRASHRSGRAELPHPARHIMVSLCFLNTQ